jgi:hypothetical protein
MIGKKEYMKTYKIKYRKLKKSKKLNYYHQKAFRDKNMKSWEGFIPNETQCQICGKIIFFNRKNSINAICFDHKKNNLPIKVHPSSWLNSCRRNIKNEKIWKSCNFGMLCNRCNRFLPTNNRKIFVEKLNGYVSTS